MTATNQRGSSVCLFVCLSVFLAARPPGRPTAHWRPLLAANLDDKQTGSQIFARRPLAQFKLIILHHTSEPSMTQADNQVVVVSYLQIYEGRQRQLRPGLQISGPAG